MSETYPLTITAWESGVLMGAIMKWGIEDEVPHLWKQLIELKLSVEAGDGVTKTFHPNGSVTLTDCDGVSITRPRHPWEMPDK